MVQKKSQKQNIAKEDHRTNINAKFPLRAFKKYFGLQKIGPQSHPAEMRAVIENASKRTCISSDV